MRLYSLIKAVLVAVVLLLAFLAVGSTRMLSDIREYLIANSEIRLHEIRDLNEGAVLEAFFSLSDNPNALMDLAEKKSLDRVAVYSPEWILLADSMNPGVYRTPSGPLHADDRELAEVTEGVSFVTQIYRERGRAFRTLYYPMRTAGGGLSWIGAVTIDVGYIEELTELGTTYFVVKTALVILGGVVLLYGIRSFMVSQRRMVQAVKNADVPLSGHVKPDDDVSFVISSFQSVVSDLKQKEVELRRLKDEAEYRARSVETLNDSILRNISSGVVTFDSDARVLTMNRAAEEILGVGACGGTGGDGCEGVALAELAGEGWLADAVTRTLSGGGAANREEGAYDPGTGEHRWLGASVSPLTDEEGGRVGAILVVADLTEVKALKERMELNERMSLLGEMSAGIAHELRNPMAVISGYSRLLAGRLAGADDDIKNTVGEIQAEIYGMDRLISEFMKFAQPTELEVSPEDIGVILKEASEAVEVASDGVRVEAGGMESLPEVEVDALLIRQAFMNIIRNAFEAMDWSGRLMVSGSVESLKSAPGSDGPSGAFVRLDFDDEGPGIPAEIRGKVFTPFFTTRNDGTGLGLALVQKIITHHGGWCSISDAPGGGTRFTVRLPVS